MGLQTVIAGVALVVASGLLLSFFVTGNETADRFSNWFFLLFYALMAWTVIEVHNFYIEVSGLIWVLTVVGLAALAYLFIGTLLVALGRVEFPSVALPTTVSFLILMLWMLVVSIVIVANGGLPTALGWLGIVVMVVSLGAVGVATTDRELLLGEKAPGTLLNIVYGLILVGLTAWIVWLGAASTTSL